MNGSEFLLGLIGLSRVERMTVSSVCSLTHSRPRGYSVLPMERSHEADILLLDADSAEACNLWKSVRLLRPSRPVLMISRSPDAIKTSYALPRANFASRLIKMLDQITIREFKFLPEVVVSDTTVLDKGLGLATKHESAQTNLPRALVVDDSVVARSKITALLGLHGIAADPAGDAEQALALMRQHRYAIVLLDVMLPGMDGYTACRQMKAADRNAPPIVMLTGRDSPFDKIRGVMAGCSRYLTKPIAADELYKVLKEFVPADVQEAQAG